LNLYGELAKSLTINIQNTSDKNRKPQQYAAAKKSF